MKIPGFHRQPIPYGEAKARIEGDFAVYLLGVEIRFTVWTWQYSLNIGKSLVDV